MWAIGVDIGGTKMRAAAVHEDGRLAHAIQVPTPASVGPEAVLQACEQTVRDVMRQATQSGDFPASGCCGVGVASAGRIDPVAGTVVFSTATFRQWQGTPIAESLRAALHLPVFVDNDVNAALMGEAWLGAAQGMERAAFVALGTGVGGALLEQGRVAQGATSSAGEFGHMIYVPDGEPCVCGARGCYEAYLAGPALERHYREKTGEHVRAEHVMNAYRSSPSAADVIDAWLRGLATLLYSIQNGFDPACTILGGGMVDSKDIWWAPLQQVLQAYPIPVAVRVAKTGGNAAIYGAAKRVLSAL
ncbi:MAG: ROK family protein [Firmicutes bacterium]|nr:ROK family protein [Bacillota bacterium]